MVEYKNNKFNTIGKLNKLDKNIRTIAKDKNGAFWLGTNYNGIFYFSNTDSIDLDVDVLNFKSNYGLPANQGWTDVYETSNGVLFSTEKGIYRYNNILNKFELDSLLGIDFSTGKYWVYPVFEDYNKNLWFTSGIHGQFAKTTLRVQVHHPGGCGAGFA
jgi:hypothetical protein